MISAHILGIPVEENAPLVVPIFAALWAATGTWVGYHWSRIRNRGTCGCDKEVCECHTETSTRNLSPDEIRHMVNQNVIPKRSQPSTVDNSLPLTSSKQDEKSSEDYKSVIETQETSIGELSGASLTDEKARVGPNAMPISS